MKRHAVAHPLQAALLIVGCLFIALCFVSSTMNGLIGIGPTPAVRATSHNLGVEPTLDAIESYLDSHLVAGSSSADVLAMLDLTEGESLVEVPPVGSIHDQNARCYSVDFYEAFHTRTLDRIFCVDQNGKVILVIHTLGLR